MDFKNMNDSELASVMVDYIKRVVYLKDLISKYLYDSNSNHVESEQIKDLYKELKNKLHKNAHYLDLACNRNGNKLYMNSFRPSIKEASAYGFKVPVNHRIDDKMLNAVKIAYDKLTGCYDLDKWENLISVIKE